MIYVTGYSVLFMSAELGISVHMEVKSYVIGLSSIPLSNQGSSLCYQEEAGNCPAVVSLLNYRRYRVVLTGQIFYIFRTKHCFVRRARCCFFKFNIEKLRYNLSADADHCIQLTASIVFFTSLSKRGEGNRFY